VKSNRSDQNDGYVEVEVLPPENRPGQAAKEAPQNTGPDPFIALVSRILDTLFSVPGTRIRFGLEPIIGFIPIFGDQITALISAGLLYRSVQHRLPKIAMVRMALNILINGVVGMIPFVGDLFVLFYKPNIRNLRILERYAGRTKAVTQGDWIFVSMLIGSTFFLLICTTLILIYATLTRFRWW
jgi:Domain of unknown function (DUF4112)